MELTHSLARSSSFPRSNSPSPLPGTLLAAVGTIWYDHVRVCTRHPYRLDQLTLCINLTFKEVSGKRDLQRHVTLQIPGASAYFSPYVACHKHKCVPSGFFGDTGLCDLFRRRAFCRIVLTSCFFSVFFPTSFFFACESEV